MTGGKALRVHRRFYRIYLSNLLDRDELRESLSQQDIQIATAIRSLIDSRMWNRRVGTEIRRLKSHFDGVRLSHTSEIMFITAVGLFSILQEDQIVEEMVLSPAF